MWFLWSSASTSVFVRVATHVAAPELHNLIVMKTFRMIRGPATLFVLFSFFFSFFAELLPKNHCKLRHFYGLPADQQYGEAGLILPLQNKLYCEMHKSELKTCPSLQRHLSFNRNIKPGVDFGKLLLLNKKQKQLVTSRHTHTSIYIRGAEVKQVNSLASWGLKSIFHPGNWTFYRNLGRPVFHWATERFLTGK